jgi:hypothetical protein
MGSGRPAVWLAFAGFLSQHAAARGEAGQPDELLQPPPLELDWGWPSESPVHWVGTRTPAVDAPYVEIVSRRYTATALGIGAVWQAIAAPAGFFLLGSEGIFYAASANSSAPNPAPRPLRVNQVHLPQGVAATGLAGARLVRGATESEFFLVTTSLLLALSCEIRTSECQLRHPVAKVDVGAVAGAVLAGGSLWVGGSVGMARWDQRASAVMVLHENVTAVSASAVTGRVAVGSERKLYIYDYSTIQLVRWEWTTDVASGQGGVFDGPIAALSYDLHGSLWVGTATCLNLMYSDGTVSRIAGEQGLPMGNHTAMDASHWRVGEGPPQQSAGLWVGSKMGVMLARRKPAACSDFEVMSVCEDFEWHYLNGPRWLPGYTVRSIAVVDAVTVVVVTDTGIAVLEQQEWTLRRKAEHYETILPRHDRHGLVAGCPLTIQGDPTTCANHDDDNNGLWTSLIVAAEAFRYATEQEPEAQRTAAHFLAGMRQLWSVTGVHGLMARSLVAPGEPHGAGGTWWNSSTMPGCAHPQT